MKRKKVGVNLFLMFLRRVSRRSVIDPRPDVWPLYRMSLTISTLLRDLAEGEGRDWAGDENLVLILIFRR